ncbi:hypothetical protein HNY73_011843 [Argiope bruennichi]|uniref:Uncharacterized protein n=1 Tax=Argiope bruennichi TaxID=94029 RepID=A0A8T0EYP8_ARGBR|nr:hypothetical protein HNY73_011843 [Argiope bruennichi]
MQVFAVNDDSCSSMNPKPIPTVAVSDPSSLSSPSPLILYPVSLSKRKVNYTLLYALDRFETVRKGRALPTPPKVQSLQTAEISHPKQSADLKRPTGKAM